jgi:hypothetical protein
MDAAHGSYGMTAPAGVVVSPDCDFLYSIDVRAFFCRVRDVGFAGVLLVHS